MDIKEKEKIIMTVIKYQKRLHEDFVKSPSLETVKTPCGQVLEHPDPTLKLFLYEEGCGLQ